MNNDDEYFLMRNDFDELIEDIRGIYISKEYWNHGYGHEVLSAIVRRCKKEGLGSVYATCDSRNTGAIKILERNGFECIDKIVGDRVDVNGEVGDELLSELELIRVQY